MPILVLGGYYNLLIINVLDLLGLVEFVESLALSWVWNRMVEFLFSILKCLFSELRPRIRVVSLRSGSSWVWLLAMEAWNLQFTKFYMELFDQFFKHIARLSHQFLSFLFCHYLRQIQIRSFKVWEQKNKYFEGVSRDLNQVNCSVNIMEISIKHLSLGINSCSIMIL